MNSQWERMKTRILYWIMIVLRFDLVIYFWHLQSYCYTHSSPNNLLYLLPHCNVMSHSQDITPSPSQYIDRDPSCYLCISSIYMSWFWPDWENFLKKQKYYINFVVMVYKVNGSINTVHSKFQPSNVACECSII